MKFWAKLLVLFSLFIGTCANAEPFKVLVLPTDLFSVCENYYCFPESSNIFAADIIDNFNQSKKIVSPNLYEIRKKMAENPQLKASTTVALNKYKNTNNIDFDALKKISEDFKTNSILLISSTVNNGHTKRGVWEVLEISTAFEIYNTFTLTTNAVLTDNVNDVVMWSGKYERSLGDNENRFWAKNIALANSNLEKIKAYSKTILSQSISQNIILRFYPKTITTNIPSTQTKTETKDFRPNALDGINSKLQNNNDYGEIQSETIFNF